MVIVITFTDRMRPLLQHLAESKAESVTLKIINDRVTELISEEQLSYDNLVTIGYNERGEIVTIGADMVKLNAFKARIGSKIQESFDETDFGTISLPIGTIIGGDYLIGRGPALAFKIDLSCSVNCSIIDLFDDAGINQTRHQIMLEVTGNTFAVAPWCEASRSVTTNFLIAETVIVGTVPSYYTRVDRSEDPLEDINNFAAKPD